MKQGHVHFVGAGPGDAELLTFKAARLISEAEAVFYDALVGPDILKLIPAETERVCVGKRAGCLSMKQREINARLVAAALSGKRVVRLKGGDPGMFGRLEEETSALAAHGITYDICPGITAASAAAAAAGVPLTARGVVRGVRFLTTASCPEKENRPDWAALAAAEETLAFYMARSKLPEIAAALLEGGLRADLPILIVEAVSLPQEKLQPGRLGALASGEIGISTAQPVLLMVGETLALAAEAVRERLLAPALDVVSA